MRAISALLLIAGAQAVSLADPVVLDFEEIAPDETACGVTACAAILGNTVKTQGFLIGRARHRWGLDPRTSYFCGSMQFRGPVVPALCTSLTTSWITDLTDEEAGETYIVRADGATFDLDAIDLYADGEGGATRSLLGFRPNGDVVQTLVNARDTGPFWHQWGTQPTPELTGVQAVLITGPVAYRLSLGLDNIVVSNIGTPAWRHAVTLDFEELAVDNASDNNKIYGESVVYYRDGFVLGKQGETGGKLTVPGTSSLAYTGSTMIRGADEAINETPICDDLDTALMLSRLDGEPFAFRALDLAFFQPGRNDSVPLAVRITLANGLQQTAYILHTEPPSLGGGPTPTTYLMGDLFTVPLERVVSVEFGFEAAGACAATCSAQPPCGYPLQPFQIDNIVLEFGDRCPGDFDGSGVVNLDDIALFAQAFIGSDLAADLNGDGSLNLDDITVFAESFVAGCP